ncbi:hypothetical protein J512_2022 [Acinetobacter baumannii 1295743]|uniref:Uncharacterized protein n=1 Tax=Acinetobacter baumannii (strain 1295743) TaxID=1310613 RepID=A0A009HRT8_ACIB9|nr:hypothetical protein J512_2022 [Acinetobacter baumannii 1295743]
MMKEPPAKLEITVVIKPTPHSLGDLGIRIMSTTAATAITQIATTIVMPNAFQAANPPIVVDTGSVMIFSP